MRAGKTAVPVLAVVWIVTLTAFGAVKINKKGGTAMGLKVTSPAFQDGGMIPSKYSYNDENISPPLEWTGVPDPAKSIALICDDPDAPAGNWVHWIVFNIPPKTRALKEGVPRSRVLEDGSRQGVNDFRNIGYDGPSPPGGTHRYIFKVYALDTPLSLEPGSPKADLIRAMNGHVLAEGQLTGRYKKP